MTRIVGYLFFSARNARACACVLTACACVHSLIFERSLFEFAGNILRLTISVKDYVFVMFTHRAHACERACVRAVWLSIRLYMDRFSSNLRWTYYKSQQIAWACVSYILIMFTHRERAFVINCSLIYGRFLFKFPVNILDIITSSMGNVLNMSKHRVRARAWLSIRSSLNGFSSNFVGTYNRSPGVTFTF
jgi:hypothetical protein